MSLLADAEFAQIRAALAVVLVHTCTITPRVDGAADGENNVSYTDGTPVTNVPCSYGTVARVTRDEGGTTLVHTPTLTVSATQAIAVGSKVSAITDQLGNALVAGTFRVERLLDDTAGLGAPLLPQYELRGADIV